MYYGFILYYRENFGFNYTIGDALIKLIYKDLLKKNNMKMFHQELAYIIVIRCHSLSLNMLPSAS